MAISQPDLSGDPRFSPVATRHDNTDKVDTIVAHWIANHPLDHFLAGFRHAQTPIAPGYPANKIVFDSQFRAREAIVTVDESDHGSVRMQNVVATLSATPGRIRHTGSTEIGQGREEVLGRPYTFDQEGN